MWVRSTKPKGGGGKAIENAGSKREARGSEANENASAKHEARGSEATELWGLCMQVDSDSIPGTGDYFFFFFDDGGALTCRNEPSECRRKWKSNFKQIIVLARWSTPLLFKVTIINRVQASALSSQFKQKPCQHRIIRSSIEWNSITDRWTLHLRRLDNIFLLGIVRFVNVTLDLCFKLIEPGDMGES